MCVGFVPDEEPCPVAARRDPRFGADRSGQFRFIAVQGWMDCRPGQRDGRPGVEFTKTGGIDTQAAR
jgi:hypothetical protein